MNVPIATIPGVALKPDADIRAIDFTVDEQESLHLVWIVNQSSSGSAKEQVFYTRGDKGGASWSQPLELTDACQQFVRILVMPDGVHIFCGNKLRHFLSRDRGNSWKELASLLSDAGGYAAAFDAVGIDSSLVVTYFGHSFDPAGGISKVLDLSVIRGTGDNFGAPVRIASFSGDSFAPLKLVANGKHLHLLCAVNSEQQIKEKNYTQFESSAQLFYLQSKDSGITWSSPIEASRWTTQGGTLIPGSIQHIGGNIELLPLEQEWFAFYHETYLYMTHTVDGSTWFPAVNITPYEPSSLAAAFYSRSVSTAAINGRGRLAWIDSRYRKSDRRWWKPLGGWPWSDAPDWANNDIFTIPLSDIVAIVRGDQQTQHTIIPQRLTQPLSYADQVQLRASRTRIFAIWSGRRKVGKQIDTFEQPAELFYTVLPLP
jgi:hypothetical protein